MTLFEEAPQGFQGLLECNGKNAIAIVSRDDMSYPIP
jgi:hypothetical protein